MAGYIFNLDNINSLEKYIKNGVYATKLSPPKNNQWRTHHEATLADYITMKEGDNVYFFIDRKIYGIGSLINLKNDCKFSNFPDACKPENYDENNDYKNKKELLLWDEGEFSINQRWLCIFKPEPYFFTTGIDMDEVLTSKPSAFRMLRAFWKVSFIKIDDEENQALKDIILKINEKVIANPILDKNVFTSHYKETHKNILNKLQSDNYNINIYDVLDFCSNGEDKNFLRHEMALELGVLYQLSILDKETCKIFGEWDYLSHQVIASPFKPIDYMDKMDIFGYSYITGYSPTRSKYLIIELKKDKAKIEDVDQLLKYVDWVKDEYCYGNYSMISAYLIAYEFSDDVINYKEQYGNRKYTIGRRPAKSFEWNNLKLIKYLYDYNNKKIIFNNI